MGDVKDKITGALAVFGAEYLLESNHLAIIKDIKTHCEVYSPANIELMISEKIPFAFPKGFIDMILEYKEVLRKYSPEDVAKKFIEFIDEARPDLSEKIASTEEGVLWFFFSVKMVYDKITAPEEFDKAVKEAQIVKVTCTKCGNVMELIKEAAENLKACPKCGEPKKA